jgi:hypothetical protein
MNVLLLPVVLQVVCIDVTKANNKQRDLTRKRIIQYYKKVKYVIALCNDIVTEAG